MSRKCRRRRLLFTGFKKIRHKKTSKRATHGILKSPGGLLNGKIITHINCKPVIMTLPQIPRSGLEYNFYCITDYDIAPSSAI